MKKEIDLRLPWSLVSHDKGRLSAVVNCDGIVVCGSLLCRHNNPKSLAEHKHIVACVDAMMGHDLGKEPLNEKQETA